MKKIVMTVAVAAMMMTASVVNAQVKVNNSSDTEMSQMQQKYEKIEVNKLPKAVTKAVEADYDGMSVTEAYVDKKSKEYKLVLQEEGASETETVYANSKGKWIKKADAVQNAAKADAMDSDSDSEY